ncbi:MAG: hypothetical protein DMD75_16480, partial [Candidatus Rokuibacteriota bacterium]
GSGPEGLPHSIIVTPEGVEGEVPKMIVEPLAATAANGNGHPAVEEKAVAKSTATTKATAKTTSKARAKGRAPATGRRESAGRAEHGRKIDRRPRSAHPTAKSNARSRRGKG